MKTAAFLSTGVIICFVAIAFIVSPDWDAVKDIAPWVSAIIAFGAFICAASTARQTNLSQQLERLDRVYSRILDLEQKFLSTPAPTRAAATAWRVSFMNALEYLAFLVNARQIREPRFREYLEKPVLNWFDTIFTSNATPDEVSNPDVYSELKRWVERIRTSEH